MSEHSYDDLVDEAFIAPIRSVLIVDDDYPTLHEILLEEDDRAKKHDHKAWNKSAESRARVRKVIDEFRRPDAPYLLDIHDGTSPSEETDEQQVHILHQTDLLILDYQLDKRREGDGSAAVRIARQALANKHFNLILVHTQEPLERVFHEFLIGLMTPCFKNEGVVFGDDFQGFLNKNEAGLLAVVEAEQYVAAKFIVSRNPRDLQKAMHGGEGPWNRVAKFLNDTGLHRKDWLKAVRYALEIFEDAHADAFADKDLGQLYWNDHPVRFIRAPRGFVAFKGKQDEQELIPTLKQALTAWNPRPPRLMLTKLRAEMNERGIEVQDDALGNPDVGAIWYRRLLDADDQNLDAIVTSTVRNHAEQLLDRLLPQVSDFAKRMRSVDSTSDTLEVVRKRFTVDLSDAAVLTGAKMGHNAFVGSKPYKSPHLEIGHILRVEGLYWLCLTPACDMVPKVHRGKPSDRIEGVKRFTALKLRPRNAGEALPEANRGGQIFANVAFEGGEEKRMAFSAAAKPGGSPAWMVMYVQNDGYLPADDLPKCSVSFVSAPDDGKTIPIVRTVDATVCGMLRYEYALEVQSRFIASQSRIGLDFIDASLEGVDAERDEAE
ncbi:response regulator receiver domain [Rhizobium laguerreae]|uniref:response regulator receiver domain n=1 Tax=Rhizobium laguerreae TaxID=1076926 RepID=UPI002FFDB034